MLLSVGLVSCGDDDDDVVTPTPAVDELDVRYTTWKATDVYSDGSKITLRMQFAESTAEFSITEELGLESSTTKMNYRFRRSDNLVVFTAVESGRANLEGKIANKIKMTLTNMSNGSEVAVLYKE